MAKRRKRRKQPAYLREPQGGKVVHAEAVPAGRKEVRRGEDPESYKSEKPAWQLGLFDTKGPWGCKHLDANALWNEVLPKLRDYESMTWSEIEQKRAYNHSVSVEKLIRRARKQLDNLNLEAEELFRFRLGARPRLWGIRQARFFQVLWWDPNHEVCPSTKKHT